MHDRIVTASPYGLFSNFNKVVSWLHQEPGSRIKPVWRAPSCLYVKASDGNLWDHLFEPLDDFEGGTTTNGWPHHRFTGKAAANLYLSGEEWRSALHMPARRIRVRSEILARATEIAKKLKGQDSVGVHIRSLHHSVEIPGGRPSLDAFVQRAKTSGTGPVFLATEQIEIVHYFKSAFGNRLLYRNVGRSHDGWSPASEYHQQCGRSVRDAIDVLVDMLVLAHGADYFIHSVSNVATAVLYANPDLPHRFITGGDKLKSDILKKPSTIQTQTMVRQRRAIRLGRAWNNA